MKNIFYVLSLSIFVCSCAATIPIRIGGYKDPQNNYIKLRSGEKIEHISFEQYKDLEKHHKAQIGNRTIAYDSIQWISNADGIYYRFTNGYTVKRIVEGEVSVFANFEVNQQQMPSDPHSSFVTQGTYFVIKADSPIKRMGIRSLEDLLADNEESVDELKKLEKNFFHRQHPQYQVEIIKKYNANYNLVMKH